MSSMLELRRCICFVFLCLHATAVVGEEPQTVMHRIQAGQPEADGWFTAKSSEGGFTVRLPSRFNDFTLTDGNKKMFCVGTVTPDAFKIGVLRAPQLRTFRDADEFFAGLIRDAERKGGLKKAKRHEFQGLPAMDVRLVSSKGETMVIRHVFLARDVIVMTMAEEGSAKLRAVDAGKFFNSLQIETRPQ